MKSGTEGKGDIGCKKRKGEMKREEMMDEIVRNEKRVR